MFKQVSALLVGLLLTGAAHATLIAETAAIHGTIATAQNVNGAFSQDFDANIFNSTSMAHASVRGTGDGNFDMYRFTVGASGGTAIFDIDYGMMDLDSWLNLFAANGAQLASNDDGGVNDAGTVHGWDSLLNYNFASGGDYYIQVGRFANRALNQGQDYVLNISLSNHNGNNVPEPGMLALLGLGALAGVAIRRRA